ncbi:FAD dependent oxidoreductase [Hortaea werneckii]|nr:FAD dependent oxidoreductase [Hortaea werneckii]KAI6845551.1 FAD dependent oxidoreductase [Hortaea werneckii]KAI6934631.1 FAD dependent oxidoreductase [Hortaea werneckii]KAI6936934.1 FAD dependent oxidoreductase [Hortaea werneckii]KAI6972426.1 FAD dependent oxidoreductase [Hortaea werneckii]
MRNVSINEGGSSATSQYARSNIMPVDNYTVPYWRCELHPLDDHRSSESLPSECDVVIIGSGMAGVAAAYHLCEETKGNEPSILMLEARQVCSGATGRNGGHSKVRSITLMSMIQQYGIEVANEFAAFVYNQKYAMKECVEREKLDCEFEMRRSFDVFLDEGEAKEAKAWFRQCLKEGHEWTHECDWIDEKHVEQVTSVKGAKGAISVPACSLWPYKFVSQLLAGLVGKKLVNLQVRTLVTEVNDQGKFSIVQTPRAGIKARKVIFATNAYTGGLCNTYYDKIIPYKGTAVHIAPGMPISPHLSNTYNISYKPKGLGVDYLNPRPDGGIVVGGGKWTYAEDKSSWFNNWDDSILLPSVQPHFSSLMQRHFMGWENSDSKIDSIWTGIQGLTADERPHVGEVPARGRAWSAGRWILATRRTYANAGKNGSHANDAVTIPKAWHGKGPQAVMGSVTTENAQKTSIEDLLNGIRPQRAQDQHEQGKSALLALLLTPSYASDALKSDLPLSVLKRLHDEDLSNLSWPLDVVTAVVDRIPSKKDLKGGHEGLAYMLQHNAEPLDIAAQIPLSPSAQKPGSLSFELPATTERPQDYTVQLPLAHTVFFSGMVSTLVHSRYTSDNGTPVMQSQRNLERETLSVPLTAQYNKYHQNVPLIPLTPFRTVRHHMGNIIRTLSPPTGPGVPNEEVPPEQAASTELEAAVTGYFEARNIQPEPVNVWAVIVPNAFAKLSRKDHKAQRSMRRLTKGAITRFWKGEDLFKSINPYLMNTMRISGARLVKVLSGGGGWGKKAGLLSLDPDSMYSNRELRSDDGWKFNFEDESEDAAEKQQKEALGEIVKEGEHIMFMLGPADIGGAAYQHAEAKKVVDRADRAALFGVIPSSIDSIPAEQKDSDSVHAVSLEQSFFGALSEGGMAVTIKQSGLLKQYRMARSWREIRWTKPSTSKNKFNSEGNGEKNKFNSEGNGEKRKPCVTYNIEKRKKRKHGVLNRINRKDNGEKNKSLQKPGRQKTPTRRKLYSGIRGMMVHG